MTEPSVVREWAEQSASDFIDWCALHGFGLQGWPEGAHGQLTTRIMQGPDPQEFAELRSRPTREERKGLSKSLRHAQKHIAFLEAKLAASEAERERLKNVVAAAYDLWREGDGQSLAMQIALSGALAGKDPTDGQD